MPEAKGFSLASGCGSDNKNGRFFFFASDALSRERASAARSSLMCRSPRGHVSKLRGRLWKDAKNGIGWDWMGLALRLSTSQNRPPTPLIWTRDRVINCSLHQAPSEGARERARPDSSWTPATAEAKSRPVHHAAIAGEGNLPQRAPPFASFILLPLQARVAAVLK